MVTIVDPVFADELIERWGKRDVELVELHASGELNPYRCKKIEIDIESGIKIGLGSLIIFERYYDDDQDNCYKDSFFDWDHNPPNTICYQCSEVMEYERLHSGVLRQVALKSLDAVASDHVRFWSTGRLTTNAEQAATIETERKSVEDRKQYTVLQEENERLKQELSQVRPPRTADATEGAQQTHVEKWKGYAGIIVKVAYDLGLSEAKGETRAEIEAVCKRHGGLPSTPYELLRDALPKEVKKGPGRKVKS